MWRGYVHDITKMSSIPVLRISLKYSTLKCLNNYKKTPIDNSTENMKILRSAIPVLISCAWVIGS